MMYDIAALQYMYGVEWTPNDCHYQTSRFLTVKGPARIIVSVDGVKVEAGKAVEVSRETCGSVEASAHQGGLVARGVSYKKSAISAPPYPVRDPVGQDSRHARPPPHH